MIVDHIRLFPIRPDVRWTQRIHEQILPTVSAAGLPIHWTDVAIPHHGYSDRATTDRKLDRNLRILGIELLEKPGNPTVLFNIGWAALSKRDARTAAGYLRASIAASTPYDGLLRQAYVLLAEAMAILGDLPAALAVCDAGLTFADDDAGLRFCRALLSQESGDPASAEADLRRILEGPAPRRYSISNPGIRGHLSRRRLASLLERRGATGEALRLWSEVLQERPDDPEAQTALARLATKSTSSAFAAAG
jgi:tetratricopeptide (TPR) repeat protein